jgi:hypothetical protein
MSVGGVHRIEVTERESPVSAAPNSMPSGPTSAFTAPYSGVSPACVDSGN